MTRKQIITHMLIKGYIWGFVSGALTGILLGIPIMLVGAIYGVIIGVFVGSMSGSLIGLVCGIVTCLFYFPLKARGHYGWVIPSLCFLVEGLLVFFATTTYDSGPIGGIGFLYMHVLPAVASAVLAAILSRRLVSWYKLQGLPETLHLGHSHT